MNRLGLHRGMRVRTAEGKRVGKIVALGEDAFLVEDGLFRPHTWKVQYGSVRASDGEVVVEGAALLPCDASRNERAQEPVLTVPLAEEELVPEVSLHELEGVVLTKEVVTEIRTIRVPVRRERLKIERLKPGTARGAAEAKGDAGQDFVDSTTVIRLHEEEVQVTKRAVVVEEVRVQKRVEVEEREFTEPVRREVVSIDEGEGLSD